MEKIYAYLGLFSLLFLFLTSYASAAAPYTVGMAGNLSERLYSGKANVMWIGDSLSVESLPQRYLYGVLTTWKPEQWKGVFFPWASPAGSGALITSDQFSTQSTFITPGAPYPDGSSGWNIQDTKYYNFTGDLVGFTTFAVNSLDSTQFSSWTQDWTNDTNLTMRLLYVSDPSSTFLSYTPLLRNGTQPNTGFKPAYFNDPVKGIYYKDLSISASTGAGNVGAIFGTYNADERVLNHFYPLGFGVFRKDISTGLQWGPNTGSGSWSTICHVSGCNLSAPFPTRKYLDNYSDYSIRQYINATDANIFFIHIGNPASNEVNGSGYVNENHTLNVLNIVRRYLDAYYQVKPNTQDTDRPYFIFLSEPDRADGEVTRLMMERSLENLVRNQSAYPDIRANATLGLIKLRQNLNDTLGAWSAWQAIYTDDGIHQNFAGARLYANATWIEIMNARTTVNGSISTWNFTLSSKTITNTTLYSDTGLFNNTDINSQKVDLEGLNGALIYYSQNASLIYSTGSSTFGCSDVPLCNGSVSILVPNSTQLYVLNNYSLVENISRGYSPLWIVNPTKDYKIIASNLTETVNSTVVFKINGCNNVKNVTYTSISGTFSKTYLPGEYICSHDILTLKVFGIEPSSTGQREQNLTVHYKRLLVSRPAKAIPCGDGTFC